MSLDELGRSTYVSLATTRRDGRVVETPVWIAPDGDRLIVYTNAKSGKVKRIRAGTPVRIAPCDMRGRLRGDWTPVRARLLEDPAERDRALEAVVRKYGWQMRLGRCMAKLSGRWSERAAIEIRPQAGAS